MSNLALVTMAICAVVVLNSWFDRRIMSSLQRQIALTNARVDLANERIDLLRKTMGL